MSERLRNLASLTFIAILAVAVVALVASSPADADRVEQLGESIKCPVCQGESIADSPSSMAVDMMNLIEERVGAGASDQEIVDELLGSFTGAVLLDPPASGSTLVLWLAPLAALVAGVGVIAWWRRHPSDATPPPDTSSASASKRRLAGGLIVVGGLAVIIGVATVLIQDRAAPVSGAAETGVENLDDVSNETMEAVIGANLDNPEIDGMRLALAERYFEAGDYRGAFPHFLAVAQSTIATDEQAAIALVRLGWMAYDGNGEVEAAIDLFDQALEVDPVSPIALYLKGRVLWCGADDPAAATALFETILSQTDLPEATRATVKEDLALTTSAASCP